MDFPFLKRRVDTLLVGVVDHAQEELERENWWMEMLVIRGKVKNKKNCKLQLWRLAKNCIPLHLPSYSSLRLTPHSFAAALHSSPQDPHSSSHNHHFSSQARQASSLAPRNACSSWAVRDEVSITQAAVHCSPVAFLWSEDTNETEIKVDVLVFFLLLISHHYAHYIWLEKLLFSFLRCVIVFGNSCII